MRRSKRSSIVGWVLGCAIVATMAARAPAEPLPIGVETTEAMMDALAADTHRLARIYGIDESVELSFTTFTNPAARTFRYALNQGLAYNGQPLTLSGHGFYNSPLSRWEGQATWSTPGGTTWTTDWTSVVTSVDPYLADFDWIAEPGVLRALVPDFHGGKGIEKDPTTGQWRSWFQGDLTDSGKNVGRVTYYDRRWSPEWWLAQTALLDPGQGSSFAVALAGSSNDTGGAGTATAAFSAIPEPGSILLIALGTSCARRRTRHAM
jgi:hypothetical protein